MKVIQGGFTAPVKIDEFIVAELRKVADRIERGEIDTVTLAYLADDNYEINTSASPLQDLVLATIIHKNAVERLYEGPQ